MASLYETAARLHDPRVKGRSNHLLADTVILAVLAVTSHTSDCVSNIRALLIFQFQMRLAPILSLLRQGWQIPHAAYGLPSRRWSRPWLGTYA